MHEIEPYYNWRHLYTAEEDEQSPYFGAEHSEFEFSNAVYNYYIHPQWDEFGSRTLYIKILYVDYDLNFAIIELLGEWNDAVENDIMQLKRSIIDVMIASGIHKYLLVTENVMNYHGGEADYYEEWYDDIKDQGGWIVPVNMPEHTRYDFEQSSIGKYLKFFECDNWRTFLPQHFFQLVDNSMLRIEH